MMKENGSQFILASWETGACITETSKMIIYIAFMGDITCFRGKLELLKSCEFWLFISKELVDTGTQTICNYFVTIWVTDGELMNLHCLLHCQIIIVMLASALSLVAYS
jgi:hypothetical protein